MGNATAKWLGGVAAVCMWLVAGSPAPAVPVVDITSSVIPGDGVFTYQYTVTNNSLPFGVINWWLPFWADPFTITSNYVLPSDWTVEVQDGSYWNEFVLAWVPGSNYPKSYYNGVPSASFNNPPWLLHFHIAGTGIFEGTSLTFQFDSANTPNFFPAAWHATGPPPGGYPIVRITDPDSPSPLPAVVPNPSSAIPEPAGLVTSGLAIVVLSGLALRRRPHTS